MTVGIRRHVVNALYLQPQAMVVADFKSWRAAKDFVSAVSVREARDRASVDGNRDAVVGEGDG